MAVNNGRRWSDNISMQQIPKEEFLYNGLANVPQQEFGLYPAKNVPVMPNKKKAGGYSDNIDIATIQITQDGQNYQKKLNDIKKSIEKNNRDNYLKQIAHIVQGKFATNNIGFKTNSTQKSSGDIETMGNDGLNDRQRTSLKNYQNSWLRISMPEGQEFIANGNGENAQAKKYLVKDGYIYEVDIKNGGGNTFVKANKYKATPENLASLKKGYDIYNLNRLLDKAKKDEKWRILLGEDISDLLPSEIKLTNKIR